MTTGMTFEAPQGEGHGFSQVHSRPSPKREAEHRATGRKLEADHAAAKTDDEKAAAAAALEKHYERGSSLRLGGMRPWGL